jgi:hypothetical protein
MQFRKIKEKKAMRALKKSRFNIFCIPQVFYSA